MDMRLKSVVLIFCLSGLEILANPPEKLFSLWEKSQVEFYSVRKTRLNKIEANGDCFGTLISDKHVLIKASCVLDKNSKDRKVIPNINESMIAKVSI